MNQRLHLPPLRLFRASHAGTHKRWRLILDFYARKQTNRLQHRLHGSILHDSRSAITKTESKGARIFAFKSNLAIQEPMRGKDSSQSLSYVRFKFSNNLAGSA